MATFKLYLINLNTTDLNYEPTYFKQIISEFYDQCTEYLNRDLSPKYSYCYTYNEKFQESTNSQKTLSFSMDRKIIRDDRIEDNPFVYNIAIGTQLLLEDKYGKQHLMTVKDIKFDFKELNLVYNYQCQDSFTWQLSRQNSGYEITNDASSDDFLGAKNIDDWTRKICRECNVIYTYRGFIDDVNNELSSVEEFKKTIPFSGSGTADSMLISLAEKYGLQLKTYEHFNDDNTITKEFSYIPLKSLRTSGLKYSPYNDIQSFELTHNGTSLSSVLNVKSNTINDDVVTLIPPVPAFFRSWFETEDWLNSNFAPGMFSKKCRVDSKYLSYSNMSSDIYKGSSIDKYLQNPSYENKIFFNLKENLWDITFTQNAIQEAFESLTTWEESITVEEEINFIYNNVKYSKITIQLKGFLVQSPNIYDYKVMSIEYDASVIFDINSDIKNSNIQLIEPNTSKWIGLLYNTSNFSVLHNNNNKNYLYISLGTIALNSNYPFVRFQSQDNQSYIHTQETYGSETVFNYHYNTDTVWSLVQLNNNSIEEVRASLDQIPESWFNKSYEYFVKIPFANTDTLTIIESELYIDFYREPTFEEIEFAKIADQCPWLENKLFNFNYFYNHNIINRKQYNDIQQYIQNNLRKASAKLLLYSQLHYEEVKNKTENLAKLESQVDTLGSIFNAEFVAPFNERKDFQSSDFITAYTSLFVGQTERGIGLLDYSKTMTSYLNKYINAEQTFLKNMYLFKNYFNAKTDFGKLYTYTVEIPQQDENSMEYITFSKPDRYQKININSFSSYIDKYQLPTTQIYEKDDNNKDIYKPISRDELVGLNNMQDEDLYYIDSSEAKYRIWTQKTDNSENPEYDTSVDYTITSHEYNPDTQYLEKQWVYTYTGDIQLNYGSAVSGMYELYKIDVYNNKAYVRSKDHCVQNKPGNLKFSVKTGENSETEINLSNPVSIYVKIGLFEMKCNYFYRCKNNKITPDARIQYRRTNVPMQSLSNIIKEEVPPLFSAPSKDNIKNNFSNYKNYEDISTNFKLLYNSNFPLTTVKYAWTENDKQQTTDVDFVNYNNAANFYRRISVSNGWKNALNYWIGFGVAGIAKLCWRYGNTSWGTEGWTYQDIWGKTLDSGDQFNGGWTDISNMVYVKSPTSWSEAFPEPDTKPQYENVEWNSDIAKNILYTPASFVAAKSKDNYMYTPYYWRILGDEDIINKDESYKIMFWRESDNLFDSSQLVSGSRINAIQNYPLSFILMDLPMSSIDFQNKPKPTVKDITPTPPKDLTADDCKWVVLHEEHYDYQYLSESYNELNAYDFARSDWYDQDHFKIDFSTVQGISDGFFINKNNENYKSIIGSNINLSTLNDKIYYRRNGSQYIKQNTLAQQIAEGNIYTKLGNQTTYVTFEQLTEVELPVNVYVKSDGVWTFKNTTTRKFQTQLAETTGKDNPINLGNMTNGLFWATYRNNIDQTVLMQKAMLIETNLTEYWTNAYNASRNCRFFIPQHWQPVINSQINYFSNEILIPQTDENNNIVNIRLNNKYIPTVKCQSEQPYYIYTYTDSTSEIVDDSNEKVYNKRVSLKYACENSPWLDTVIKYLNIDKAKCIVTIPRYDAAHYTHESGGQTWYDMLNSIGQGQFISFDKFGGWYDMIIKTLNTRYYSIEMTQYEQARTEHSATWHYLHKTYPHLIYEKEYENEDATTSEQLLAAATFAFREYNDIERQYNIQTIDLAGLKGYQGQCIQVGDAIEIDADELYEAYDDIKTSLLQYLYISDISYSLRSDSDIQLTVNNIKYSDKVIGELVKLIR